MPIPPWKFFTDLLHRVPDFFPIGHLFELYPMAGGIATGVLAATMQQVQHTPGPFYPGYMLALVLGAMTVEIVSCYLGKTRTERKKHNWEGVFIGKLFIILLGVCGFLLDSVLHQAPHLFPNVDFKLLGKGYFPITTASLVWFVIAEVTRAVNNIRRYEGKDSTTPKVITTFLRNFHGIDEDRARAAGLDPLPQRLIDHLTPAQIEAISEGRVPDDLPPVGAPLPPSVPTPDREA